MFGKKENTKAKQLIEVNSILDEDYLATISCGFDDCMFSYKEELKKPIITFLEELIKQLKRRNGE